MITEMKKLELLLYHREKEQFLDALREAGAKHPIEEVGARLRSMMPWLSAGKQKVSDVSGG